MKKRRRGERDNMKAEKYFYKEDKWYHIKVEINQELNQFDCFVDGVKLEDLLSMEKKRVDKLGVEIYG